MEMIVFAAKQAQMEDGSVTDSLPSVTGCQGQHLTRGCSRSKLNSCWLVVSAYHNDLLKTICVLKRQVAALLPEWEIPLLLF